MRKEELPSRLKEMGKSHADSARNRGARVDIHNESSLETHGF